MHPKRYYNVAPRVAIKVCVTGFEPIESHQRRWCYIQTPGQPMEGYLRLRPQQAVYQSQHIGRAGLVGLFSRSAASVARSAQSPYQRVGKHHILRVLSLSLSLCQKHHCAEINGKNTELSDIGHAPSKTLISWELHSEYDDDLVFLAIEPDFIDRTTCKRSSRITAGCHIQRKITRGFARYSRPIF
jgi:hypothetical protein